ncbi:uncharacterized protein LOC116853698 isoform X2 [Odontomachus brunneus]|uniref:uncharacterized protein LOC116853698 isoform X2 n=1 Tax=Odontomachus brunneus TaxID=486640 RepID=UPI0013F274F8|nr:uncharacterized protein LOC116853698 isoform X2 [Odontomachus brunneus]
MNLIKVTGKNTCYILSSDYFYYLRSTPTFFNNFFLMGKSYSTLQIQECEKQKYMETEIINKKKAINKGENAPEETVNRILDMLLVMNRKLDSMLAFHDEQNPSTSANCSFDLLPHIPLNSMEDFKKFCNDLNENEELRKQFQKKIRNIGGKSAENHLINCLVTTLTNELAKQLTWEGQRHTKGTISNMYNSSNYYSLKNKFSEWLRRAGDRYRYQLKKLEHTLLS